MDIVVLGGYMEVIALNDNLFTGTIPQGFGFFGRVITCQINQLAWEPFHQLEACSV
jgi:hypothetical protein